jgi:hypothetical protein
MFGSNPTPPVQPPPVPTPPPPNAPTFGISTQAAGQRATRTGQGYGSTILTSGAGLTTPAATARKTLLGQ